jgi:hypothetical protein
MKKLFIIASVCAIASCGGSTTSSSSTIDSISVPRITADSIRLADSTKTADSVLTASKMSKDSTTSKDSTQKDNWIGKGNMDVTKQGKMVEKKGY